MDGRMHSVNLISMSIRCMSFVLLMLPLSVTVTYGSSCVNRLDLVIAVDTTSSESAGSFDAVKAEVKGIVSGFTVGQANTRLALVSMSSRAQVIVNFNAVNSLADFNSAVDRLTVSTDRVDLADGIKVSKESVLSTGRADKTAKVLVLVKDKRSMRGFAAGFDPTVLSRVAAEAASVKTLGAFINAVGVGGLWSRAELTALFGPDYLLFKDKNKALESVKSLNNLVCKALCPNKGVSSQQVGLCYKSMKHVLNSKVDLAVSSAGLSVCRKEINREFVPCSEKQRCTMSDRKVGSCLSGMAKIESVWQSFDYRVQSCVATRTEQTVACYETMKCVDQMAEVIFVLDQSGSIRKDFHHVKLAANTLISSLNIGPDSVRVGVITFGTNARVEVSLEAGLDKDSLMRSVQSISENIQLAARTYTHLALESARQMLDKHARREVARFVVVITDGDSWYPVNTLMETALVKNAGATVYAIGIGSELDESELRMMTTPDSATNTVIVKDFNLLESWSRNFSKQLCLEFSAPSPRLCDGGAFVQSISECIKGKHQITRAQYVYSASSKCLKTITSTVQDGCQQKCIDPIDGNEYFQFDKWTNLCHEFQCKDAASTLVPLSSKCMAADGSCKEVGAPAFKCRDDKGVEVGNCQCVLNQAGKVSLVIDSD